MTSPLDGLSGRNTCALLQNGLLHVTPEIQHGVLEEKVLRRIGEDFVAMPHVCIDHLVSCVCPGYGNISTSKRVLESSG